MRRGLTGIIFGKSSQNSPKQVLIFGGSIPWRVGGWGDLYPIVFGFLEFL